MMEGAIETTPKVLQTAVKAAILHPATVRRAQEGLDRVVGQDRLLTSDDLPQLPYIEVFIKECMRWLPPFPLGFPHSLDQDDEFMGYRIPKGCLILQNHYAMSYDSSIYPEQYAFKPGVVIDPWDIEHKFTSFPGPFQPVFVPRSRKIKHLVETARERRGKDISEIMSQIEPPHHR